MTTTTEPVTRRRWLGIRARIVIGYVALLAAALAISILVTRQVLVGRLDREIDHSLEQEIDELRILADGIDPETGLPFGTNVRGIFDTFLRRSVPADDEAFYTLVDGVRFLSSFDAPQDVWRDQSLVSEWAGVTTPQVATVHTSIGEMRYLAVPLQAAGDTAAVFVVAHFADVDREEILVVVRILMVAGLVVLIVTAAFAWSLAGRILRPVRELTTTARQISETDLSRRIPVEGHDELAELGSTFNDMVARLDAGFTQQRDFLDSVAHELRTPITIVQGHLELMGDDPADRAESTALMTDELDRMGRYVNDLLLLAKAEQGDFLKFEPIDLGELAATIDQRARGLGDRAWQIDAAPAPGTVAMVGDRDRLVQAMLNLLANAVQHTADGDEIATGIDADLGSPDPVARLWVRDTGPGLDLTTIDQLFQRQYRSATSRAKRSEGMGIGLSIVDAIARGHGGSARAENEAGGGSRFTITVPLEPPGEITS